MFEVCRSPAFDLVSELGLLAPVTSAEWMLQVGARRGSEHSAWWLARHDEALQQYVGGMASWQEAARFAAALVRGRGAFKVGTCTCAYNKHKNVCIMCERRPRVYS